MGKKLTIEEVKLQAKELGKWIILDDCYEGAHAKLNCQCTKCGYVHQMDWRQIKMDGGCVECSRKLKLLSIKYIKEKAFKKGWLVLSNNYESKFTKLDCQCAKCGYKTQFVWRSIQQNIRCEKCRKASKLGFIRAEFAKEGYILLTKTYENSRQKLEYICPDGHRYNVSWREWKNNCRCPFHSAYRRKLTIEFIRAEFAKEGYTLLTKIYKNAKQKLDYICPRGHKHSVSWDSWSGSNTRCPCFSNMMKPTIESIRADFAKEGYILLTTEYKNCYQKLKYICPEGHRHSINRINWRHGQRCPERPNHISKWEKKVKNFLTESNIDYVPNNRTQLVNPNTNRRLELDMWFPELNKAIECNGIYWHSKERTIKTDKIKKQLCKDQGIDLLVVTDEEWNDDIDKCKAKLISFVKNEAKHVA